MRFRWIPALALLLAACSSSVDISNVPELPVATAADVEALLATTDTPVIINVWASWCVPCRSEAPLLERAATTTADEIRFVGLNVRDDQSGARGFIAEFFPEAPIDHLADPSGAVPIELGGNRGVPLTFFYDRSGTLVELHSGVIDERTLALQIDEILRR
jgi:cytochrome c biogenesis protein CcmG/thiol:disulfide interchange protein DsbE